MTMRAINSNNSPEVWLLVTTLICVLFGFFVGLAITRLHEVKLQKITFFATSGSPNSGSSERISSRNISKIYIASNPCKSGHFSPRFSKTHMGFSLNGSVGNETVSKQKYLLTIAVGIQQKDTVSRIVSKFSEEFAIMMFHYDGKTSEWDQFEWSQRAIHITAFRQTKWWYAKRFLHPDVVGQYEYIFMWDEDLGVEHFNGEEYINLVKKYDLEISQPAVTSKIGTPWKMTLRRNNVEVHKVAMENHQKCADPNLPPCAGFVEIMVPVFSRKSWNCVWQMLQNDLVHGWGLDFAFWRCVEKPHESIGVVDAQWIEHLVFPTLGGEEDKSNTKISTRIRVRARSFKEWKEFERRIKAAEKQQGGNGSSPDQFRENGYSQTARKKVESINGKLENESLTEQKSITI